MQGNEKVIAALNDLLADELTAINQYMVHSEMCENWKYMRLYEIVRKRAFTEMRHAEALIERILFLDGTPTVSFLKPIYIGPDVETQLKNDWGAERDAINHYARAIRLAMEVSDFGTKELLESILREEEDHIDMIEAQRTEIAQVGIQNYLASQIK